MCIYRESCIYIESCISHTLPVTFLYKMSHFYIYKLMNWHSFFVGFCFLSKLLFWSLQTVLYVYIIYKYMFMWEIFVDNFSLTLSFAKTSMQALLAASHMVMLIFQLQCQTLVNYNVHIFTLNLPDNLHRYKALRFGFLPLGLCPMSTHYFFTPIMRL